MGLLGLGWRRFLRLGSVIEDRRVWIGGSWPTMTGGEDQFRGRWAVALNKEHVAAGAVE